MSSSSIAGKQIESFYSLKAISSFFVVLIHTSMWNRHVLDFIVGIGTPCFLAITGYLLYSDSLERELSKCKRWAKKIFILSIFCNIVYAIPLIFKAPYVVTDPVHWLKTLLFHGSGMCYVLWYLTALWQALLIFAFIRRFIPKCIYFLPLLFILLYLLRNVTSPIIPFDLSGIHIERNSFITSITFLATGYIIHQHRDVLLKWIKIDVVYPVMLLLAFIETCIYIKCFSYYGYFHFSTFPLIVLTMLFCIKHSDFNFTFLTSIGKKHSANIYYFHILFADFVWNSPYVGNVKAILVWLTCIPFSILFNKLQHCIKKRSVNKTT